MVKKIKRKLVDYLHLNDTGETALESVWEALKLVIQGEFIAISTADNRRRTEKRKAVEQEVEELEKIHKRTGAPRIWRDLEARRRILKHLDLDRAEHALLRLRHKFYIGRDKCGKLLARLLRAQTRASMIQTLRDDGGREHTEDTNIVDIFRSFYQSLYTGQDPPALDPCRYLEGCRITPLPRADADALEVPIRPEEVISPISRLKVGKSPGPDGFSALFYKSFCFELAPLLTKLFNSFLVSGTVTKSMSEAAISVILKLMKDPKDCRSYRPISLLNIDAKLFSSILATRLNPLMTALVEPDQAGYIPTRQGGDNTKRLFHLMDGVRRSRKRAFFRSIDAEKAFDRVSWSFLFEVLRALGFGDKFMAWIQSLYRTPRAFIKVNGCRSASFLLSRGTRQGCPLSPLLFALYTEPLAQRLRDNALIEDVKFVADTHKISLYADDIILSLTNPQVTLPALMTELQVFGDTAGFKVNISKSLILNLSIPQAEAEELHQRFMFQWTKKDIPYLGIRLAPTLEQTATLNHKSLIAQTTKTLDAWSRLKLAWVGDLQLSK